MTFSNDKDERRTEGEHSKELIKKKEIAKEAEAEACDIHRKSDEDLSPEPGNPNFWPSAELDRNEDLEPPSRNKPDSSPWCETKNGPQEDSQEGEE